jgi:hypothetical protein
MKGIRLGVTALTGSVKAGIPNKDNSSFKGGGCDVTGDFLRCIIEKAEFHGGTFDIQDTERKGPRYWVTVTQEPGELN